jgi:hypothetical protein
MKLRVNCYNGSLNRFSQFENDEDGLTMNQTETVKQKLYAEIETLPQHRLRDVLNFVDFVIYQESQTIPEQVKSPSNHDPLSRFIGGVENGTLAKDIDMELYGS